MAARRVRRWFQGLGIVVCGGLCAMGRSAAGDEPTPGVSARDFTDALVETSLADGEISAAEREAILTLASRSLSKSELASLELRLDSTSASKPAGEYVTGNGAPETLPMVLRGKVAVDEPAGQGEAASRPCDTCHTGLCDNLSLFGTFEGFKGPVDLGSRNGNFGVRFGLNWGYPLWEEWNLGVQLGSAVTIADFNGTQFTGDDERYQSFTTLGLFQRTDCGINWGFGYDWLSDDYYHNMDMQQWRLQIGYECSCSDEVGIWMARGTRGDSGVVLNTNPTPPPAFIPGVEHRDPMLQGSLFWRHVWSNDAATRVWVGLAEEHGEWVIGCDALVPLCDGLALVGEANFISPSSNDFPAGAAEEIWSLSLGIAIYPAHTAKHANHSRYAPLLPVANNGTFAVDKLPE